MRVETEEHIARLVEKGYDTREEGAHLLKDWFASPQKTLDLIQKKIDERIRYFFYHLTGLDELERQLQELEGQLGQLEERLSRDNG
jgi:polyhydroxyalkanoate synthesis regulator phasin